MDKAQDRAEVATPCHGPEPLAAKPEPRALVADERAEAAGARPAAAPVVRDDDRAGSREHEHARPLADRAEERRPSAGYHLAAPRQAPKRELEGAARTRGPERARAAAEAGHAATA